MLFDKVNACNSLLAGAVVTASVLAPGVALAQTVAQASGPVTAISELSDVQPTDWAFQALQSLVERYGCIAGYPDRTYRGNRAMTRFEFAAGMNACLDRINELIAAGLADKVSREDLATLQRLQEEFAAELAALKGRVDTLEADVADLQGKVFNPVTKLKIELITGLVGSGLTEDRVIDGELVAESDQANMTFPYRMRMIFDSSFVGNDRLRVRLQARDAETDFFSGDPGFDFSGGGGGDVVLDDLLYQFQAFDSRVRFVIGLNSTDADQVFTYDVPWDQLSNFFDTPKSTQDAIDSGVAGFRFNASEQFTLSYAYTSDDPQDVGEFGGDGGVTGGDTGHYVELGFSPVETANLYFQFGSSYVQNFEDVDFLSDGAALFQGPLSNPADVDEAFAPTTARVNAFTFAADWEITPSIIFSGWVSFGNIEYELPDVVPAGLVDPGDEDINGWLAGFLFPDLLVEGAEGHILFGQPIVGTDATNERPFAIEVAYGFPLNDYLKITPGLYFVTNPNGAPLGDNDPTIGVGALRATFSY